MRDADERGDNKYLEWRSQKKDLLIKWSSNNEPAAWSELHDFVLFTYNNLDDIKEDKKVIDRREPYREDGQTSFKFKF